MQFLHFEAHILFISELIGLEERAESLLMELLLHLNLREIKEEFVCALDFLLADLVHEGRSLGILI